MLAIRLAYFETSASTGQNVAKAIETLLDLVMRRMQKVVETSNSRALKGMEDNVRLGASTFGRSGCYC